MSALLRSARLLKSSPISLFQIAGANIRGSALSRLYSGALVGRGVRVNPRQSSFALGVNRFAWPLAAARHTGVAPRQESESRYQGTSVVRARQGMQFDEAVTRLNRIVRRSGRITKTLLMTIFHDSCRSGFPSGNLALLLLRSCGSLLAEVHPSERTEIVHKIWDKLREKGMTYDISHYNTLLKVYLQNEHKFSVTEFLAKMEAAKIQPNRVMYQSLVAVYCQEGDIEGAGKILECMKSAEMPISEAIFNSLITGHSRAGDMESAQDMLEVMKAAGIEPGSESYLALLNAYVEKADMEHFKELLEAMNRSDVFLMDNELMEVLFTLAKAGHHQHIPEILALMSLEHGYLADAMNLCLRLLNLDLEDTVMTFLKTFPLFLNEEGEIGEPGSFLLRHCVYKNKPIEKIQQCCRELQEAQLHSTPLQYSLQCALEANKAGLALQLMKMMKLEEGLPVRPHYFWPLLAQLQKENNKQGALEILKNMEELGVPANVETFQRYILPYYSSTESAYSELKEAGYEVETADFTAAQLRVESMNGNLERVFSLLSSYTLPALNLITFRGSLTTGFRMSSDPEIMAKITALLFKDKRFCLEKSTPNENGSNFVHSLISGMPADEIRAQEEKLRQYLNQLKSKGITIQGHHYKGIHMALNQTNLPQLQQAALELVDLNGINDRPRMPRVATGVKVPLLERKLEEAQAAGEPVGPLLKALISALCENADLTRALELKARHQADMPVQAYISLLNCCCQHDMVEQALSLKAELLEKDPSLVMTDRKYLVLIRALAKRKMLDEAVDLLREMKEKSVPITSKNYSFFHLLNFLALQGDEEGVNRLQAAIFSLGLAQPSNVMCSPPITLHLTKGDYVAALEAVLMCLQQYSLLPRLHDVLCGLVEKGEKEHLQRVMNLVSTEWGERTMLYDLFFAFLQTGRFKEARKIIESPGMIARPGRLQWFAEKCVVGNHVETLDNLVDMTVKLYECDRDDMYNFVFRLCHFNNDWEKALATWTKMQEENVVPRERTQLLLARILKNNGQEVPFVMPEVWYEKFATVQSTAQRKAQRATDPASEWAAQHAAQRATQRATQRTAQRTAQQTAQQTAQRTAQRTAPHGSKDMEMRIMRQCNNKVNEAFTSLKEAVEKNIPLSAATYTRVIKALLAGGNMAGAMVVQDIANSKLGKFTLNESVHSMLVITMVKNGQIKEAKDTLLAMIPEEHVPSQLAVSRLVQALADRGDLQGVLEVQGVVTELGASLNLSRMLFINNIALAHIMSGNVDAAVEGLEAQFSDPDGPVVSSIGYLYRQLLQNDKQDAIDKLTVMAERLANESSIYRAAVDLFLEYVHLERKEDARLLLQRCAGIAEQKSVLGSYMVRMARSSQARSIETLQELIPDFTEKEIYYSYLVKCYKGDLPGMKAMRQQMQEEGVVADPLTLHVMAGVYKTAGEAVPFEEPTEASVEEEIQRRRGKPLLVAPATEA